MLWNELTKSVNSFTEITLKLQWSDTHTTSATDFEDKILLFQPYQLNLTRLLSEMLFHNSISITREPDYRAKAWRSDVWDYPSYVLVCLMGCIK